MTDFKNTPELSESTETAISYSTCYQQCFLSDNLELMKTIESNTIDLIYCDILYGTGRNFGDYQDLKPIRSEIEAHYLPRLKEMHRVLKSTGSIYLQMDYRIVHWIRCIMDDIFGYENFRNEIIVVNKRGGNGKEFMKRHDNILFYSKTNKYTFNKIRGERYNIKNQAGKWAVKLNQYTGDLPYPADLIKEIEILMGNSNAKIHKEGGFITDVWVSDNSCYRTRIYDTEKPKSLIEKVIKASSNEGDTVADYYLGSGTTAVVCKELNRNFIGCDINPKAIEITNARLDALS